MTMITKNEPGWQAISTRDAASDGTFVYGVVTTGVYCRPSCRSRRPNRENVRFFADNAAAEKAGFRACLRCRPNEAPADDRLLTKACRLIEESDGVGAVISLPAARIAGSATAICSICRFPELPDRLRIAGACVVIEIVCNMALTEPRA